MTAFRPKRRLGFYFTAARMTDMIADRMGCGILGHSSAMVRRSSSALILVPTGATKGRPSPTSALPRLENMATLKVRKINANGTKKMDEPSHGEGAAEAAVAGAVAGAIAGVVIAAEPTVFSVDGPVAAIVVGEVVILLQEAAIPASTTANRMAKPETLDMNFPYIGGLVC